NAGNLTWVISKSLLDRIQVVIRHNDGICRSRTGNTRRIWQSQGSNARSGSSQERIHVTVVASIKLQDLRAASKATCQTHSRHGGLRTGVDQANLFRSGTGNNFFRQQSLPDGRSTEAQAILSYFLHSLNDVRVCIAVNHRAIRADQVDKGVAINIREL